MNKIDILKLNNLISWAYSTIESGEILLTLEKIVKRLQCFDPLSADLDHTMIMRVDFTETAIILLSVAKSVKFHHFLHGSWSHEKHVLYLQQYNLLIAVEFLFGLELALNHFSTGLAAQLLMKIILINKAERRTSFDIRIKRQSW